jgi:threonine synthase
MQFVSTRGGAVVPGFSDAVLAGLASDGGLYVPQNWPQIAPGEIAAYANRPYAEVAFDIIRRFVDGDIPDAELKRIVDEAYATFRHPSVAPLVELEPGHFMLELFHGPTLAFKDVAMQFLAPGDGPHPWPPRPAEPPSSAPPPATPVRRGDRGLCAVATRTDIFILHPAGASTSPVQQRQMTTVTRRQCPQRSRMRGQFRRLPETW